MPYDAPMALGPLPEANAEVRRSSPLSPPPPSSPSTSRTPNPLSSKLSTVLSTSYADSEFRDALSLLNERGVVNSARTRRHLRLDLQKDVIVSNKQVIDEFGSVAEQLRRIGATLDKLNRNYDRMRHQVSSAHDATSAVIGDATSLMARRRQVESKQLLLQSFRDHYVLSEDEVATLSLTSEPIDGHFFSVLSKAKQITKDCELLLGLESQTLGLQVMEQASKNINFAFQKLFRWIQREFKALNLENPQIGSPIRHALRVLAERPSLFQSCLDSFAEAREQVLSDAFYTALTGTSLSGAGNQYMKPIELAAHDPLRYAGDMLAWIHSATVSEREALEVLFVSDEGMEISKGLQASSENQVWRLVADEADDFAGFDAVKALNDLVDRDVAGAIRVLRQRVEQIIQTNEDTILAYKLANLLNFYRITFAKLLSPESLLVQALSSLESEALRQFRSLVRDHIAALQGDFQHTPSDLAPPGFLQEALEQLRAIMKSYDTSLTPSGNREVDFQPVLAEALDPFLQGCGNMSQSLQAPADSVFVINCLRAAQAALEPFDFTRGRQDQLNDRVREEARKVEDSQYAFLRHESGLDAMFVALGPLTTTEEDVLELRALEVMQPAALAQARQRLDDFLPSALMDAMENVKFLQDSSLALRTTEDAAGRFCQDFEHIEDMLMYADEVAEQEAGGQADAIQGFRTSFPRTTGEIRVLLS